MRFGADGLSAAPVIPRDPARAAAVFHRCRGLGTCETSALVRPGCLLTASTGQALYRLR